MKKQTAGNGGNYLLKTLTVIVGALVTLACIYLSFYIKFKGNIPYRNLVTFKENHLLIFFGFILISILFGTYIFYDKTYLDLFFYSMLSQAVLAIYMMALSYAGGWSAFPRSVILINFFVGTIGLFLWNAFVYWVYHRVRGQKKILVVGEADKVKQAVRNFSLMENKRHTVTHVVLSDFYNNVKKHSNEVDIVYLAGHIKEEERIKIYNYLMQNNKKLFLSPEFQNLILVNPNIMSFQDESVLEVSMFQIPEELDLIKRIVDIVVSLLMLIIVSPIMLITAIAIKLDSKGPVLYKQERVTKDERVFNVLKFRSMTVGAESKSGPVLAQANDSRVTKVGKFIRSTRIDELPQLINVLKGDMSLVGPRPERPYFVEQYKEENPHYYLRHNVRAGITGYAQVYGKYTTDFNSKLNFDLLYIQNYSLLFDLKLLFRTIKILFDKVSSRGLSEESEQDIDLDDLSEEIVVVK